MQLREQRALVRNATNARNRGVTHRSMGGGLEGAERTQRETMLWSPHMGSPDQIVSRAKPMADARGRDMVLNDGLPHGAVATHKDSIVGSNYRLNAAPVLRALRGLSKAFDEEWSEEFQEVTEARFGLVAESDQNWLDATGTNTLTGMTRLAIGGFMMTGENLAVSKWLSRERQRPCSTAVQMVSPSRLSNKDNQPDEERLKRGIRKDANGRAIGYYIRTSHPRENFSARSYTWEYVPAMRAWGRRNVLHTMEQFEVDQSRGVADMVAVLKHMRMTKNYSEIALQNAVVQASYAACLESDLPPDIVYGAMGANNGAANFTGALGAYMEILTKFFGGANNVAIDGAKVPVLPPGVKLNAQTLGTPGGIGSNFEESLHRHTAAGLGLSYEEYTRDFTKSSYSSNRASAASMGRFMKSRKKAVADRFANFVYENWLEEDLAAGNLPLPRGVSPDLFYEPLMREAFTQATWIGAGAGQVDELKETQAAILRVRSGFSTYETEIARFGGDWREVFKQRAREEGIIGKLGLGFNMDTKKPTVESAAEAADPEEGNDAADAADEPAAAAA